MLCALRTTACSSALVERSSVLGSLPRLFAVPRRAFTATALTREARPASQAPPCPASATLPPVLPAFAFDIDGVLKQGKEVIPAAHRALKMIRGENKFGRTLPHVFLTNGGGTLESQRAELLQSNFGGDIHPDQVVLSHSLMKSLDHLREKDVLVIEPAKAAEIAKVYGFQRIHTPDMLHRFAPTSWTHSRPPEYSSAKEEVPDYNRVHFAAVLVFHDNNDWGRTLQYVMDLCRSDQGVFGTTHPGLQGPHTVDQPATQLPLYFAHNDLIWTTGFGVPRLGLGAYRVAAEAIWKELTGRTLEYTMFGKPERATYKFAERTLAHQAQSLVGRGVLTSTYMVGDNPASDISGAARYGWNSVLVRTGVWNDEQGQPSPAPTLVVDDVEQAVALALRREWGADAV